jgi:hypothetical protein
MTIQEFVISEYGKETGSIINEKQQGIYQQIIAALQNKSKNQEETLKNIILPRIALYKALLELQYSPESSFTTVKKYLDEIVGKTMNDKLRAAEKIPGFFSIFRKKMYKEIAGNDNWKVRIQENSRNAIKYTISECLWYTACKENGCSELCQIFCDVDHIIYGNMKKVAFTRTGTIGKGQDCCDFSYVKK